MRKITKKIVALTLASLMALSLTACGGKEKTSTNDTPTDAASPTKSADNAAPTEQASGETGYDLKGDITITSWNSSYTAIVEGAKKFMELHPEAKITVEQVSDNTKLYTQLATGTGVPDIMQFQNRDNLTAMEKYDGAFLDISDLMSKYEKDIVPAVLPLLKNGDTWYSAPWDVAPAMMFYRTDIFADNGIDPASIVTWDDFINAGKTIKEKTGGKVKIFGFDYNGTSSFDMPLIIFYELGGSFFDQNGNVQFNTEQVKTAFEICKKMIDEDISMNLPNEWTDRITALANGTLCAVPYGVWFAGTLQENLADQSGKWGCMPLPAVEAGGNNQANSGGSTVMVSSSTKYPDLCKAFIEYFFLTTEGSKINMDVSTLFDSYMPAYTDASYTDPSDYFGMSPAALASELCAQIPDLPFPAYFTDIGQIFQEKAIGPYFVDGGDINSVLDAATEQAQKQLEFLRSE